jgi:hypothetical protein
LVLGVSPFPDRHLVLSDSLFGYVLGNGDGGQVHGDLLGGVFGLQIISLGDVRVNLLPLAAAAPGDLG